MSRATIPAPRSRSTDGSPRVAGLTRFPESGRPGRVEGTRGLVVGRTPYVVVYRIGADGVQVPRVLHGTRRWPEEPSP